MLQEGQAGTDVAMAVASTAADLDTRAAKATSEADRQMIHVPRSSSVKGKVLNLDKGDTGGTCEQMW